MRALTDQVAIVTGGARGIGFGIASVLAGEGAAVVIADVDAAGGEATAAALRARSLEASAAGIDVAARDALEALASEIADRHGRIDILAANAGIYPSVPLAELEDSVWDRVMDVNVKGAVHAVQACLPHMLARGYGRIVLTSSVTGPITGHPGYGPYGASKAAMLGFMRSAAMELARTGVVINAVLPGNVQTPGLDETSDEHRRQMLSAMPMGRFATVEDVGWAVRFLAAQEAAYITGQTLVVDGGQVLPEAPGEHGEAA
jgi:3-oxoacyl-[acyl-carrier protein] reductase